MHVNCRYFIQICFQAPKILLSCPPVTLVPSRSTEGNQAGTPTQKQYLSLDIAVRSDKKQKEIKGFGKS